MKTKTRFAFLLFSAVIFLMPFFSFARENVTDWYIKDFDSKIVVNQDSTLNITEKITADCGDCVGKHGIFRILPQSINIQGKKIKTPVQLLGIKNEKGDSYEFAETKDADTVTWKIGDPDKTVQGTNVYIIEYKVKNAIRFQEKFDELYWNLNGNFWELETDRFHASVIFPEGINQDNAALEYYTGYLGEQRKDLARYSWFSSNVLQVDSTRTLKSKEGITVAVTFPKNIITPYQPSFWEKYGEYFFFLFPVVVFVICFLLWKKYGDDPRFNRTVIAQYEIPENLSPVEMGVLMKSGSLRNEFITAEIIFFATRGLIIIKEFENKVLFFTNKDYELTLKSDPQIENALNSSEKTILNAIFLTGDVVKLSELKTRFHRNLGEIKKLAQESLKRKDLIQTIGITIGTIMIGLGGFLFVFSFIVLDTSFFLWLSLLASAVIMMIFGAIMPKRTEKGTEVNWQVKGFKLFMETVDKDRAAFYEKENIFEKFLPYAILFGMTGMWIKRMQEIYGEQYYSTHVPVWYIGGSSFDADSFSSSIEDLSASITANTSAPSGSGGAGGSGGGGGGGGGGGW